MRLLVTVPDLDLRRPVWSIGHGLPLAGLVLIEQYADDDPFERPQPSAAIHAIERAPSVLALAYESPERGTATSGTPARWPPG